jgi:hypothetical protein
VNPTRHVWVKVHLICGVKTNVVTAAALLAKDSGDSPQLGPLAKQTAENFTIKELSADKAYLSHDNLALIDSLGGELFVPLKCNSLPGEPGSLWDKLHGYYTFRQEEFLKHYHKRSSVEATFSMIKRKLGDSVRSKTDVAMKNEVLGKVLAHNIMVNLASQPELDIEPVFWPAQPAQARVIPLVRRAE